MVTKALWGAKLGHQRGNWVVGSTNYQEGFLCGWEMQKRCCMDTVKCNDHALGRQNYAEYAALLSFPEV